MSRKKLFNDPVYGFISLPYGIVFDLVEHPYFQRLRRIKQLGLTHYVYPGALHTRFHHALGAVHLMGQAIEVLRSKGVNITDEEANATTIAILLHDIGHGPFSHALEHKLVNVHHEYLSIQFMEVLNKEFEGQLTLAIQIFKGEYEKLFLHQLISGQLDMDRLDYLTRDSFFTGVHEGVVGYDRIIKMLAVHNNRLVVEEKGIYSIEKFLIARRLMYWQVYLHKTALCAEQMLIKTLERAKTLARKGVQLPASTALSKFLYNDYTKEDFGNSEILSAFASLDDFDITLAIKEWSRHNDIVLSTLSSKIINRELLKVELRTTEFDKSEIDNIRDRLFTQFGVSHENAHYFILKGKESNMAYNVDKDEINVLFKDGRVLPMSEFSEHNLQSKVVTKHYLCYPKKIVF